MKTRRMLRSIVLIAGLAIASASSINAQTSLDFTAFETGGISDPSDLDFINVNGLIVSTGDGVSISITNSSLVGSGFVTSSIPTVTKIFFEDIAGVLSSPVISSSSSGVEFASNPDAHLPGGNAINFVVESAFSAVPPPSASGLDPGEYVTFLFAGTDYDSLVSAISLGTVRVGLHIQEIGQNGEDSASFVNVIPEPSAALLGCIGAFFLLKRRR